jgi:hypothetical protein
MYFLADGHANRLYIDPKLIEILDDNLSAETVSFVE